MVRELYLNEVREIIGSDYELDQSIIDRHVKHYRLYDQLRNRGPSVCYLFNNHTLTFEYMSPGFKELTGYEPNEIVCCEEGKYLDLIHPDDMPILVHQVYPDLKEIASQFSIEDKRKLTVELNFRIRTKDGSSFYNLEQFNYLEFDDNDAPILEFGRSTKIISTKAKNVIAAIHILHENSYEDIFHKIYHRDPEDQRISKREKEILRLLSAGKTSKEIGEMLYISSNTVNNHRRSLLKKVGVRGTSDLVRYAIEHSIY